MVTQMEKVLIRMPNWVGDFIMAIPALENLQNWWSQKEFYIMSRPHLSPLLPQGPSIKGFIPYPPSGGLGRFPQILRTARVLSKEKFHKAILFQNAFEAAFVARIGRIPEIIGYNRDLRGFLLTRAVAYKRKREHHVYYYLGILKAIGIEPVFQRPRLKCSEEELASGLSFLKDLGLSDSSPILGISPGAAYGPAKRWPLEHFKGVISHAVRKMGLFVLIFGSKEEKAIGAELGSGSKMVKNLCGKTDLSLAKSLISFCSLFVSNDSGLMHMASALDIPLVAIFGSTDPTVTGPLGPNSKVLRARTECAPCFRSRCPFGTYQCLRQIQVEEVLCNIESMLGGKGEETSCVHR